MADLDLRVALMREYAETHGASPTVAIFERDHGGFDNLTDRELDNAVRRLYGWGHDEPELAVMAEILRGDVVPSVAVAELLGQLLPSDPGSPEDGSCLWCHGEPDEDGPMHMDDCPWAKAQRWL
jgi:hypothetical protein